MFFYQLIARLKREVQMLKEELELLRGEQREEQLTGEQIHRYVISSSCRHGDQVRNIL